MGLLKKKKKDDEEDKKEEDVAYMEVDLGGKSHRIDRMDMSDDEWEKTKQTAMDKGVFKFSHDREVDYQKKKAYQEREEAGAQKTMMELAKKREDSRAGEMIDVEDGHGNTITMRRGDQDKIDPERLRKQLSKPAEPEGKIDPERLRKQLENTVDGRQPPEAVEGKDFVRKEPSDEEKLKYRDAGGGGTGTMGGKLQNAFSALFKGATPDTRDELQRALDGASSESSEAALSKKLESRQKTESSGTPEKSGPSKANLSVDDIDTGKTLDQALSEKPSARVTPGRPVITNREPETVPQPVPMQPPMANRGPPEVNTIGMSPSEAPVSPGGSSSLFATNPQVDQMLGGGGGAPAPGDFPPGAQAAAAAGVPSGWPAGAPQVDRSPPQQLADVAGKMLPGAAGGAMGGAMASPAAGGSASMSVKSKGFEGPPLPELEDRRPAIEKSFQDAQLAQAKTTELESKLQSDQADLYRSGLTEQIRLQLEGKKADDVAQQHLREKQSAFIKTLEEARAPEKVDPNHWWSTRNTAQKIFAVISAGLTKGATMQMFQNAIDADIDAQKANISNTRQARSDKLMAQGTVVEMARRNGLDDREQRIAASAMAWNNIEKTSSLAALTAKSEITKANALTQAAMAGSKHQEELVKLDQYQQTNALAKKKLALEEFETEAKVRKLSASGTAKPKAGKGLAPKQATDLADLERGKKALESLQTMVGKPNLFENIWRKATDGDIFGFDVIPWGSDSKLINAKTKTVIQLIAPGMGSGTLQKDDMKRWDEIMGRSGDLTQDKKLQMVLDDVKQTIKEREKGYKQAGYNMKGYEGGEPPTETMTEEDAFGRLLEQ